MMTREAGVEKKKIAVIVPSQESLRVYNDFLSRYTNFSFKHYFSIDEFNKDVAVSGSCAGFVIDWRVILNSGSQEKEYFKYLLNLFPTIRVSHSLDKKEVSGDFRGRMLKDHQLFDYFFYEVFPGPKEKRKKTIILIAENSESRLLYESYLRTYPDISYQVYSSVKDFIASVSKDSSYCGFIIDVKTFMKESPEDRKLLNELIERFPAIQISGVSGKKNVKGAISDKNLHDRELFDYFVKDLCYHFIPRGIRKQKRQNVFLNVYLDISSIQSKNTPEGKRFSTNTLDVTEAGAFILGDIDVKKGDKLHLVINELNDQSPIECTVMWVQPWGETISQPTGFGVIFTGIKPQQEKELITLLHVET
jgi:Tfp pilus assembly protein PilZ